MAAVSSIWLAPHRPLFLAAGLWALVALVWWHWGGAMGLSTPVLGTSGLWHGHEMLFGLGSAAVGGYFLTASMSWRGADPLSGRPLMALVALWLLGRVALLAEGLWPGLPLWLLQPAALGYFLLLGGLLAREAVAARRWPKLGFAAGIFAFGLAETLYLRAAVTEVMPDSATMVRVGWMFFAIKISIIGGRMVPAFTLNWLRQAGLTVADPAPRPALGWAALGLLWSALALTFAGEETVSALALIAAGILQGIRLAGWRGWHARGNLLLLVLHATFGWLAAGLVLVGLARLGLLPLAEMDALHALTMGAMSGMILSLAARAAAPRDGGPLRARPTMIGAFALIWSAALLRLAAPLAPSADVVTLAAALWCLGWLSFLAGYLPTVLGPVARPVFSGPRAQTQLVRIEIR
ncbi:NnrS family protein [Cereibacter sphaeroides]|uniref:NnrS family protein n=1 Tax=Cereibacter sphaeroides TaxID=1063 RepID=UPI001F362353|nr:NnrS family protein [Cereibacter sphaeroides]MCE6962123.1 NnrS family protein [Cereibacter sphaeroides]MCE6971978.1 NnrS family protein [Cereibacter sphaeroides]